MMKLTRRLARPNAQIAFADMALNDSTVVFTHGAGMDHTMFDAQVKALVEGGYRVIAWDMRGHGKSTLAPGVRFTASDAFDDLVALLDACKVNRAVLVGHSFGGNLAQAFVRAHADRAVGLIVMDSTWNTGPLSKLERFALRLAAPMLRLIPAGVLSNQMARASAISPPVISRTEAIFARMPKHVFLDVWQAAVSFIDPDPGFRSPVPLALVRGAQDRTGNIATAMPRWAQAEGIAEHIIPDAGHILTWDAPNATSSVLLHILDQWGLGNPALHQGESR